MTRDFLGKGMNFQGHEALLGDGDLVFMLNGDVGGQEAGNLGDFVQNSLSNSECLRLPAGYVYRGAIKLGGGKYAIFSESSYSSEIGLFDPDTCAYVTKFNHKCLEFDSPVKGVHKSNRIYFIQEGKPLRFFDMDECPPTSPTGDCFDCARVEEFDCKKLNLNRCVRFPKISLTQRSGNLPNGSYQIAVALTDNKQRFTGYQIYPEIIQFHTNNQGNNRFGIGFEMVDCPFGAEEYELVLITHREDRGTQAHRVGYFNTSQSRVAITEIDGTNDFEIDLSVLLQPMPIYVGADHIATNNEVLVLGGVKTRDVLNYQLRANQIKSRWVVKKVKAKDAHLHYNFMRGEVYKFSIVGQYCDGELTRSYHIPCDSEFKIKSTDPDRWSTINTNISGNDYFEGSESCGEPEVVKYWDAYDTSTVTCDTYGNFNGGFVGSGGSGGSTSCEKWALTIDGDQPFTYSYTDCDGVTVNASGSGSILEVCTQNLASIQVSPNVTVRFTSYLGTCGDGGGGGGGDIGDCDGGDCDPIVMKGDFGHWESVLKYPDNPCVWGQRDDPDGEFFDPYGLACQGIRYHKFPDSKTVHITEKTSCTNEEYVLVLGVEFYNILPFLDKDGNPAKDITGIIIEVEDRTNQKSILHKGMLYNMWEEQLADCTTSYYANYPFNDLHPDVFLSRSLPRVIPGTRFSEIGYAAPTQFSRSKFQYISPDIAFERNDSGDYLQICAEMNGFVEGKFRETNDFPPSVILSDLAYITVWLTGALSMVDLTLTLPPAVTIRLSVFFNYVQTALAALNNMLPPVNYAMNALYKSVYKTYNTMNVVPGNIRRKINFSQYLLPAKMYAGTHKVNNYQREAGLFLDLGGDIADPYVTEYSRIRLEDNDCVSHFGACQPVNGQNPVSSSYYAAIKVKRPSQYGQVDSGQRRRIFIMDFSNSGVFSTGPIFGGDVRITKHKYVRKFPFFSKLPLGLPIDTVFETSNANNVWHPRYWLDNIQTTDVTSLVSGSIDNDERNTARSGRLRTTYCGDNSGDCDRNLFFRIDGKFYTHVIGVSHYWCESEYVADFREKNEIPESDIDRDDNEIALYRTLQYPELFLYNDQYRFRGVSNPSLAADPWLDCCNPPKVPYENRIVYSLRNDPLSKGDAWLKFYPASIQQFSERDGLLTGMVSIDEFTILFFFEGGVYMTQPEDIIETQNGRLSVGSPDIFSRRLRKLTDDVSGFGGCRDITSVQVTKHGVFWFDRDRSKFVGYGRGITDLSGKMAPWFQRYLKDTESIISVYDTYTDNLYFTGKGKYPWTLSFKPAMGGENKWVSFHSFVPDDYLPTVSTFISIKNSEGWKHNDETSYQTYYGERYPFEVGFIIADKMTPIQLQDVAIYAEFFKVMDWNKFYQNEFFNKMWLSWPTGGTGLKNLFLKNRNNESHYSIQNNLAALDTVEVTELEANEYRLNMLQEHNIGQPLIKWSGMDYQVSAPNTSPTLPPNNNGFASPNGRWFRVHLIKDKGDFTTKVLLNLVTFKSKQK